jgi:hypothetical protein
VAFARSKTIWTMTALLGVGVVVCMAGGATARPYRDLVQALQISDDTFMLSARRDAHTDNPDAFRRYALAKIAAETLESGYDIFQFTDLAGNSVGASIKPGQTLLVKMSRYPAPSPAPLGMYDAQEVMKTSGDSSYEPPQPNR